MNIAGASEATGSVRASEATGSVQEFRTAVRAWLDENDLTPGPDLTFDKQVEQLGRVRRALYDAGWMRYGWPAEVGGLGGPAMLRAVLGEEVATRDLAEPGIYSMIEVLAPTMIKYASPELAAEMVPRLLDGSEQWCQGFSEPGSGSDLASLSTRAEQRGDQWVINGQKMWTSLIAYADYVWLAVRTDPDAKKHKGISILIVPTDAEGFSYTPVHTMAGPDTSATYYQDVRVPASALVGEENGGWALITNQLNHERVALTSAGPILSALREVRAWAQQTQLPDGRRVIDQEWVQVNLARVHAKAEYLQLMNWDIASGTGPLGPAPASANKVFGTEFATEAYRLLMEILGPAATVRQNSPGALLRGRIERMHRSSLILTFGGGTNEVQRDIIAMTALGMPPSKR